MNKLFLAISRYCQDHCIVLTSEQKAKVYNYLHTNYDLGITNHHDWDSVVDADAINGAMSDLDII